MLNLKTLWFLLKSNSYILYQVTVHCSGLPESSGLMGCLVNNFREKSFMVLTVTELHLFNLMKMTDLMFSLAPSFLLLTSRMFSFFSISTSYWTTFITEGFCPSSEGKSLQIKCWCLLSQKSWAGRLIIIIPATIRPQIQGLGHCSPCSTSTAMKAATGCRVLLLLPCSGAGGTWQEKTGAGLCWKAAPCLSHVQNSCSHLMLCKATLILHMHAHIKHTFVQQCI